MGVCEGGSSSCFIIFGSLAFVFESIGVYLKYFWMLYKVSGGWFRICLPACIWISLVWLCSRCVFGVMGVFSAVFYGFRNVFFLYFGIWVLLV